MVYNRYMKKAYMILLSSLLVCYAAAFVGSAFTFDSIPTWYAHLQKPFFNPPNWVFGPVWTVLYTAMGYALYLVVLKKKQRTTDTAIAWFALQLILNTLWSIVFFGLHLPGIAFIILLGLWISIYITIQQFNRIQTIAGKILIPYICWVTFAGILNASIVILN